jgi:hypothetical protein
MWFFLGIGAIIMLLMLLMVIEHQPIRIGLNVSVNHPTAHTKSTDPTESTEPTESTGFTESLHPMHQASCQEQLAYWNRNIPDWSAVKDVEYRYVAIMQFDQGRVTCVNRDNPELQLALIDDFARYIRPLLLKHPEWTGRIFIHSIDGPLLGDVCKFPVLSWNVKIAKWGKGQLLGVDPYYMTDSLHGSFPKDDDRPFAEKQPILNFRGNTTNRKRRWAIQKYNGYPNVDFKFSSKHNEDAAHFRAHPEQFGTFMSVTDQRRFKYLVNIDGYGAAWNRTEWQLRSNSIMFLDTEYYMFTSKHLKPWVHYVPISVTDINEKDDLLDHFQLVRGFDDAQASSICEQARLYAKTYNSQEQALLYTEAIISRALELYRTSCSS